MEDCELHLMWKDNGLLIYTLNVSLTLTVHWKTENYPNEVSAAQASTILVKTLKAAVSQVEDALKNEHNIEVHSMLVEDTRQSQKLHLSLSRPIQLWTGQRAAFTSACRAALNETKRWVPCVHHRLRSKHRTC